MRTDELKEALTSAVSTVDTLPGFTDRVVHGGRRRRRRRRLLVLATALSTVLALGMGSLAWNFLAQLPANQLAADARFGQAALGGRAGDEALRREALAAFERDWPNSRLRPPHRELAPGNPLVELRGPAHVYWAGETPAGPAVVLLHRVLLPELGWESTMLSLVGKDAVESRTRLLGVDVAEQQGGPAGAFLFGPGDRTLLVVAQGRPVAHSDGLDIDRDGRVSRTSVPLSFTDGIAIAEVPATRAQGQSVLTFPGDGAWLVPRLASEHLWYQDVPSGGPGQRGSEPVEVKGTGWSAKEGPVRLTVGSPALPADRLREIGQAVLGQQAYRDPQSRRHPASWDLVAGLSGNRSLYLTEVVETGRGPSRVYGVVVRADQTVEAVRYGGVGTLAALPVRLRLPGDEGWLLAGRGVALQWRTGPDAAWQSVAGEQAIVPATARQVQVTEPGRPAVEFELN